MKRMFALATLVLCAGFLRAADTAPSQVTLPLPEYETLRRSQERASVTVVDTIRLAGSFRERDVRISFTGRSSGSLPTETALSAENVVLFGCDGEAIVSRGEHGAFALTPLASRFAVNCRLASRGSDRIEMSATRAVLWIESAITDGEFVWGSEDPNGARSFSIVRRTTVSAGRIEPSATGRYLLSLRPDETRFRYALEAHNPNRSRQAFDVELGSGEHVQQVDAPVAYEVQGARYQFDLPPGDTTVVLTGSLPGKSFMPPVDASVQYCVLEAHPMLRPMLAGNPKRISAQETGITAEFRGAQAFLLTGRQRLAWTVTRLEILSTTSFALRKSWSVFFLSPDGWALGESAYEMDNQGAADVTVPIDAQMTYAGLNGEPALLTKDAQGNLWLPISQGEQKLVVQHRQPFTRWPGFAFARLVLPQMPVPSSQATIEIRYPEQWFPLYTGFLSEARYGHPGVGALIVIALLMAWSERSLAFLGMPRRTRIIVVILALLAAVSWGWAMAALVIANVAVTVLWLLVSHAPIRVGVALILAVVFGFVALLIALASVPSLMRSRVSSPLSGHDYGDKARRAARMPIETDIQQKKEPAALNYQGLPAKYEIPGGVNQASFSREMLDTQKPRFVRIWAVSHAFLGWLQMLFVLSGAIAIFRVRRGALAGWRARILDVRKRRESMEAKS
ncbi:MAG: hypothetical protein JXO72_05735 [Vicinamibacteria bacterium]|nr:hypothetical protein [Vicinamibacteria bacterium]